MSDQKNYLPDQINEIAAALCVFQGDVPEIELDQSVSVQMKTGGAYSFKYASFPNILKTINPAMKAAGLSFTQLIDSNGGVLTILLHNSGQSLQSYINPEGGNQGDLQKLGSKITYLKRYSLTAILGISAETDDDGNTHQGNTVQNKGKGQQGQQMSQREELTDTRADGSEKPWLNQNSEEWKDLIANIFTGAEPSEGFLAYTIKHFFKVSKATRTYLQNIIDQKKIVERGVFDDDVIFRGLTEYEAGILRDFRVKKIEIKS